MSWDEGPYFAESFYLGKWRRYHAKRAGFYLRVHSWMAISNIVCSSAAFASIQGSNQALASVLAAAVAVASTLELVFKPSQKADAHRAIEKALRVLAQSIERLEPTPNNLKKIKDGHLAIDSDQLYPHRVLVEILSHAEEGRFRNVPERGLPQLTWLQRKLAHFCDFNLRRIDKWKGEMETE